MPPRHNKPQLKIVLIGDSGVGKTSLIRRYTGDAFDEMYKATIGVDFFEKQMVVDEVTVSLNYWDTAGQERFRSLSKAFYRGCTCCVMVFDLTNAKSFENLRNHHADFMNTSSPENIHQFPFIVLGNKKDLDDEAVTREQVQEFCESISDKSEDAVPVQFFYTSAREREIDLEPSQAIGRLAYARYTAMKAADIGDSDEAIISLSRSGQRDGGDGSSCCV